MTLPPDVPPTEKVTTHDTPYDKSHDASRDGESRGTQKECQCVGGACVGGACGNGCQCEGDAGECGEHGCSCSSTEEPEQDGVAYLLHKARMKVLLEKLSAHIAQEEGAEYDRVAQLLLEVARAERTTDAQGVHKRDELNERFSKLFD